MPTRVTSMSPRSAIAALTSSPTTPPTPPATTTISDSSSRALDDLAQPARVGGHDADPADLGARVTGGGGQRVRVHVVDLALAGRAVDVDELLAERDHRDPRTWVDEHLVASDGGQQTHLSSTDGRAAAHGDVAGLHVLAGAADEPGGRHAAG